MLDAIKLIKQDHKTIKNLFRAFDKASKRSERQKIAEEIIEELSVHAAIEEQLIYPALRLRDERRRDAVLRALEEHHAAKLVLAELDAMKVDDERYAAKVYVVREEIEAHIDEEEAQILPRLETLLDAQERQAMAEALLAMKRVAPTHPHPAAPDVPPGNVVASVLAKLSDSSKDILRKLFDPDKAEGHRRVKARAKASAAQASRSRRAASEARAH